MPVRLLICAKDMRGVGPGQYRKGDIADVREGDTPWSNPEGLPDFIQVEISDATRAQILSFRDEWNQNLDWEVVNSDLAVDGHRLLLWTTNRGTGGQGDVTREQAVNFLERWGAVNIVTGTRGDAAAVRFDITVYTAATSEGFWGRGLSGFSFSQLSYVQGTGVHDIRVTYPAGADHSRVLTEVAERAQVLGSNAGARTVDYRVTRAGMLDAFKAAVKGALQEMILRRRFAFTTVAVDQVIGAGGSATVTAAQAQANLVDKTVV
jgi:hypothetical protein